MHGPTRHLLGGHAVVSEEGVDHRADVAGQHVGDPARQSHPKAEVRHVPRHVVGGGGIRAGGDIDHSEREAGAVAARR
jgi:hypothetical protein